MNFWTLLLPPVAGTVIGYFTNDIAINMLFRPYKAIYLGDRRLPFTPGLIPANQDRLARNISRIIMGSLLTPEEIQKLAQKLLQTERIEAAIRWLLQLAFAQIQGEQEQKTAGILAAILRDLASESLPRLIKVWSREDTFLEAQVYQLFDQLLLDFKLTEAQARQLTDWLLRTVLTPDILRQATIDFLTDKNIEIIDTSLREKTSGTYWVVANLFGVKNSLTRLRAFCLEEREIANARLQELILTLEIRLKLRLWLQGLSLQNLPVSTVRQLRKSFHQTIRQYFQDKGAGLMEYIGESVDWDNLSVVILRRLQASQVLDSSLGVVSQELSLLLDRYLEKDLEKIISQVIPILAIDQVIIERVNNTSPRELERAIQGIVKNELQAIVNLGGVLGFLVGVAQSVILLLN
ncbi:MULTISPECIES: DUF445 domain-containing protein [Cyanophyceae]|uniref:DUF445 domain-containing protein n=2 Tax=Cyanobacteriota TaxID=1117 RepID=UPI0004AAA04C|nr:MULTISPECIES: DUF445 family protein [unclassified Picosynechococcus]AMA08831.1 hypothetical protein AWQ23_05595 [Picosynechococcus sp. PCC 73109]ANV86977.1 hypothetical protein AWQ22_05575 [Picosynechococcus sp. PCC 7117]ANV90131.1 hypothetical protein AWQ24_05535 [Picosynechococcus sp. PCC 8807]QCS49555.1 DUF445 family protein [Picosynechococcus sp. PCC 11901]